MDRLQWGNIEEIASWCGVPHQTAYRWKTGRRKPPEAALRIISLRGQGDAASILGEAWRGWIVGKDGLLYRSPWVSGFGPGDLTALAHYVASNAYLSRETKQLEIAANRARKAQDAAEARAAWYQRQLVAEARLGAFLTSLSVTR